MTIVWPLCARHAPPQKPVFHGSPANRFAAQTNHCTPSPQQHLGPQILLVLHNAAYRLNPNPRADGPSPSHHEWNGTQRNITYIIGPSPHSVVWAGFQAVFADGSQGPCPHEASHRRPRTRFASRRTGVAKSRRRLAVAWPCCGRPIFVRSPRDSLLALRILRLRPCRTKGSDEKVLANGARPGYHAAVNLDIRGEEV